MKIRRILVLSLLFSFYLPSESIFASGDDGIFLGEKIQPNLANRNYSIAKSKVLSSGKIVHVGTIDKDGLICGTELNSGLIMITNNQGELDNTYFKTDEYDSVTGYTEFNQLDQIVLLDVVESSMDSNIIYAVGYSRNFFYIDEKCTSQDRAIILKVNINSNLVDNFGASFGSIGAKFGIINPTDPHLKYQEVLTSILELPNGDIAVSGYVIYENSSRDEGFIAIVDKNGLALKSDFGASGIKYLDTSKIVPWFITKPASEFVLFGGTPAEDGFETNNFGITSISENGNETSTFKGGNNYRWSDGNKEGIYRQPITQHGYIYVLDGLSDADFLLWKIETNGHAVSNYGGRLKSQLSSVGVVGCGYCSGSFAVDSSDRILIGITQNSVSSTRITSIVRLEKDGLVDSTFGENGKLNIDSEYGTTILALPDNKFLFIGIEYKDGVEKPFFRNFSQMNRIDKPAISNYESNEFGFQFKINNFDSSNTYVIETSKGVSNFDTSTAVVHVSNLSQGHDMAIVTVSVTKPGYGVKISKITGYSKYTSKQITEQQEAAVIAERERAAQLESARRAELRAKAEAILMNPERSNLSIETYRDLGFANLIPEVINQLNDYVIALPISSRLSFDLLRNKINELVQNFRLDLFINSPSVDNLKTIGFKNISPDNFNEVNSYLKDVTRIQLSNSAEIQKIIDSVNTLMAARKGIETKQKFPSLDQLKKIDIPELDSNSKSWIYSQFRKAPLEVFKNIASIRAYATELKILADNRKLRNQIIIEKIKSRKK